MKIEDYQNWVKEFYQAQGWYQYNPFIRVNFLSEEVGEVARAVRAIEIGRDRPDETEASYQHKKDCLVEELGDVLDNLFILADKYDISIEEVVEKHKAKFTKRYAK
ncbi:MazG nucleotide pyrophosphohydrolase domain-containing protein [Actinobacillus vicugnae]|uniref:MazG nucleotide pyrophosphohydrolase domain-containing protein n=1 Tax=Actinobacillus vicugnae TaxID=2573093 RepID=UPI0012419C9A|nr:MazG-like family protein [Actinobacillus vicugnae]